MLRLIQILQESHFRASGLVSRMLPLQIMQPLLGLYMLPHPVHGLLAVLRSWPHAMLPAHAAAL